MICLQFPSKCVKFWQLCHLLLSFLKGIGLLAFLPFTLNFWSMLTANLESSFLGSYLSDYDEKQPTNSDDIGELDTMELIYWNVLFKQKIVSVLGLLPPASGLGISPMFLFMQGVHCRWQWDYCFVGGFCIIDTHCKNFNLCDHFANVLCGRLWLLFILSSLLDDNM